MPRIVPIPAVNAVIYNSRREILLTRRSTEVREPGKWCLPGGHLDSGEDWIGALRREIREELGLRVKSERLIGIYSDPKLTITPEVLKEGYHGQFVVAVFQVLEYDGQIIPNEEVDQWAYFSADKIPSPMIKSHPIRMLDAFQFKGEVFVR